MMDPDVVRSIVHDQWSKGDVTILDYIAGVLEDEHFEFGDEGLAAYEAIGPFLVRRGSPVMRT